MIKTLEGPPTAPPVGPKTTHSPKTRADRDDVPDGWTACPVPAGIPPSVGTAQAAYAHDASGAIVVMGTPPQSDDDEGGHDCDAMGCGSVGAHILWRCAKPGRPVTALVAEARRLVEKMRTGAGGWGPLTDEMLNTMSTLADRVEQLEREAEARRMSVDGFSAVVDAAARHARRPRGGQQVPFHGDFAGAGPSVITRLEWWARALREMAPDPWHPASEPPAGDSNEERARLVLMWVYGCVVGYFDADMGAWTDGDALYDGSDGQRQPPTHWRELPAGPAAVDTAPVRAHNTGMTQARRADGAYLAKHAPADAHPDPRAVRKAIADELRRRRTSMAAGPRTLADVCKVAELAIGDVSPRLSGSRLLPWSMVEALARGLGVPVSTISSTIPATYKKST